jgi:hypothetical protein
MSMIGALRLVTDDELRDLFAHPEKLGDVLEVEGDDEDLDKAWHGLHFLFTGTAWEGEPPLNFLVAGGTAIGDEEYGYDIPRGFASDEVREIADALGGVSPEDLRTRFDPAKMLAEDIYPEIWDRDPADDDTLGYLLEYFDVLKAFVNRARERSAALIVYIV